MLLAEEQTKIKVFFFLSNLSGGGAQRTMVNLLKSIDKNSFSPTLVLLDYNPNDAYASLIPDDIEIINLNSRGRYAAWKVKKIIESKQPDKLFSTLPQVNFAVWLGNKISNRKPKLILRETNYRKEGTNTTVLKQKLYKTIYRDADRVIGLSEGVSKHMIEAYQLDATKVTRIYNPVDIEGINIKSLETCEISYTKKIKMIACGRLAKQKNYPLLIKALGKLKDKGCNDFELFIMGEGPDEKILKRMISDYGLTENIRLIGFRSNPYAYMRQADLFILSSLWEGFGHVVVESMACGTPVLATDCPHGPREILKDGEYGWLVPNNDLHQLSIKLGNLMHEHDKIRQMSNKVYDRARDFDVKNIIRQYESVFREIN